MTIETVHYTSEELEKVVKVSFASPSALSLTDQNGRLALSNLC